MNRGQNNLPLGGTNAIKQLRELEVVSCPECEGTWFEQIVAEQFSKLHTVIPGQKVLPEHGGGFYILRCMRCSGLLEPTVQIGARDASRRLYDRFLDEMQEDYVKQTTKEQVTGEKL